MIQEIRGTPVVVPGTTPRRDHPHARRTLRARNLCTIVAVKSDPLELQRTEEMKQLLRDLTLEGGEYHTCTITTKAKGRWVGNPRVLLSAVYGLTVAHVRMVGTAEDERYIRLEWYRALPGGSFLEIKGIKVRPSTDSQGCVPYRTARHQTHRARENPGHLTERSTSSCPPLLSSTGRGVQTVGGRRGRADLRACMPDPARGGHPLLDLRRDGPAGGGPPGEDPEACGAMTWCCIQIELRQ
jgi:hypothetical protein